MRIAAIVAFSFALFIGLASMRQNNGQGSAMAMPLAGQGGTQTEHLSRATCLSDYAEMEWTYLMLREMGFSEEEAFFLAVDSLYAAPKEPFQPKGSRYQPKTGENSE